jgi:predicted nuclease with TOPRIM domain
MSGTSQVTDVRIIVEGLSDVIKVSEALRLASLGGDYGATVTSIIPTTNPDIARNAAFGADVVIVAFDNDTSGSQLSERFDTALDGMCGAIEHVRLPSGQNVEYTDVSIIRDALEKAIVRAGLQALALFAKSSYEIDEPYPLPEEDEGECEIEAQSSTAVQKPVENSSQDTDDLIFEINRLELENSNYESRVGDLERRVNELLIDAYERYDISEVWSSLFDEEVPDSEEVAFVASRLADDIYVSNNFIFAQSLKKVEDFLQTVKDTLS